MTPRLPRLTDFFRAHGAAIQQPRVVLPFHRRIFSACRQWATGTLPDGARNLAVCMPPRHGKTFIARDLVAWGLGCWPDSQWIYTSSSATLAVAQTMAIKTAASSDWYSRIFPWVGVQPTRGRQDYFETPRGGSVYGVGVGGTITGFGAGKKRLEFGGGIIIDDPLQAQDAYSVAERDKCNRWYTQVLYSRRNSATTPVMLIMQRLHEMDLVGYVREQEPDLWHVLEIPVMDDAGALLWPETFSAENMRRVQDIDTFAFSAQYMQAPTPPGGAMIKPEWLGTYTALPNDRGSHTAIFADTALKTGQHNDYSVFLAAMTDGRDLYVLDVLRGRWDAPDLIRQAVQFWHSIRKSVGGPTVGLYVEDKASGTGLIQTLHRDTGIPVVAVPRSRDKVSRVQDVLPYLRSGRVLLPERASWVNALLGELAAFSPAMTHRYDDQVDALCDAVATLLGDESRLARGRDLS